MQVTLTCDIMLFLATFTLRNSLSGVPCILHLMEFFSCRLFVAQNQNSVENFCYFHITCGLYLCGILHPLHVAGALRNLVFAVFCIALTLQKYFFAFCSMHEDSTMQNPNSSILIFHVACN